jgi:hypothetical protein
LLDSIKLIGFVSKTKLKDNSIMINLCMTS